MHATLRRYVIEGIAGLTPRSRAPRRRTRKVTLSTIATVRRLQRNPGLGAFRMHAKLKQLGIDLSPRTCGRIMAMNRQLYADLRQDTPPHTPKAMPFHATRRHQYWTADIRYLDMHTLGDGQVYAITILENYSRAILASAVSRSQDLTAYLLVLFAALQQHGCPEALVTDGGAVFKADQAKQIYAALAITHHRIPRRQSWQSYLETNFNVMRRMADWDFGRATSWRALVGVHDQWVGDFHYQVHWAHRHREDNRHSPVEVLGWVRGQVLDTPTLTRVFQTTRFVHHLDRGGYVQFRHWKLYAEQGLAGQSVDIWLHAEDLTITYAQQPLAQYTVTATETTTFDTVTDPQVLPTDFQSPQAPIWELTDAEWHKMVPPIWHRPPAFWGGSADAWLRVVPRTSPRRRRRRIIGQTQFPW
ncbi:MAG: transposase family protein [Blastochloris sp.]|nr:transposase family protein [Blastochloris sp.]